MAEPRITRCPFCNTAFRVNAAQLAAAKGSVRCGSCRHVFSAFKHMVATQEQSAKEDNQPNAQEESITASRYADDTVTAQRSVLDNIGVSRPVIPANTSGRRAGNNAILWTLCCTLTICCLLLQYIWFNTETLAQAPSLRPALQIFCDLTDCPLPPRVNLEAFKVQKLLVRNNPERPETLKIDAIIYNDAGFSQPFPRIGLTFNDLQDVTLASRIFQPQEYLGGEAANMEIMPAALPVRLQLEIIDPDQNAVNYHLSFIGNPLP